MRLLSNQHDASPLHPEGRPASHHDTLRLAGARLLVELQKLVELSLAILPRLRVNPQLYPLLVLLVPLCLQVPYLVLPSALVEVEFARHDHSPSLLS